MDPCPPRRRVVVVDRGPRQAPLPLGQGTRRIDRPVRLAPAVSTLPASDVNKITFALRMLDRLRGGFAAHPTHEAAAEYGALHWLLEECGVILGDA